MVAAAQKLMMERKFTQAVSTVERVLEQYWDSQQLWSLYLKLKAQLCYPTKLPELYALLSKATATSRSYAVMFEVRVLIESI